MVALPPYPRPQRWAGEPVPHMAPGCYCGAASPLEVCDPCRHASNALWWCHGCVAALKTKEEK